MGMEGNRVPSLEIARSNITLTLTILQGSRQSLRAGSHLGVIVFYYDMPPGRTLGLHHTGMLFLAQHLREDCWM